MYSPCTQKHDLLRLVQTLHVKLLYSNVLTDDSTNHLDFLQVFRASLNTLDNQWETLVWKFILILSLCSGFHITNLYMKRKKCWYRRHWIYFNVGIGNTENFMATWAMKLQKEACGIRNIEASHLKVQIK